MAKKKKQQCTHEVLDIITQVAHTSEQGKITGSSLDVTVTCIACGHMFEFMGVASKGYDKNVPTASHDMTVLHIPIRPSSVLKPRTKSISDKKMLN